MSLLKQKFLTACRIFLPPGGTISAVPCMIIRPGCYRLTCDLDYSAAAGTAIDIRVDGVTIDLQGFALRNSSGSDSLATGIGGKGLTKVSVTNGKVRGFQTGIHLQAGRNYHVVNMQIEENWQFGMCVEGTDCTIHDNVILDTGGSTAEYSKVCIAMRLWGPGQSVERNVISGMRRSRKNREWVGVGFDGAPRTQFTSNTIAVDKLTPLTWGLWLNGGKPGDLFPTNILVRRNLFVNLDIAATFADPAGGICEHNLLVNTTYGFLFGDREIQGPGNLSIPTRQDKFS